MNFKSLILSCFLALVLVTHSHAEDYLRIAAFDIPHILEENGKGLYSELLFEAAHKSNIKLEVDILPIARARAAYKTEKYDCLVPLDPKAEGQYLDHLQSHPLKTAYSFIFTNRDDKTLHSLSELNDLRVGAELGVPYPEEVDHIIGNNRVPNLENLVHMLERSRFEAIIAYTPDMTEFFDKHEMKPLNYDPKSPVSTYHDSLTCKPNQHNKDLLAKLNKALVTILEPAASSY